MATNDGTLNLAKITAPASVDANKIEIYNKTGTDRAFMQDENANEYDLTAGNPLAGAPVGATIAVGAEGGADDINVTIQLTDHVGSDIAIRGGVHFYLADDANGDTPSSTPPDGGIAIGTDGAMIEWAANLSGLLISESDGDIDITLIDSGAPTFYLIIVLPTGKLSASAAITFA